MAAGTGNDKYNQ